jgi:hypothetical protein
VNVTYYLNSIDIGFKRGWRDFAVAMRDTSNNGPSIFFRLTGVGASARLRADVVFLNLGHCCHSLRAEETSARALGGRTTRLRGPAPGCRHRFEGEIRDVLRRVTSFCDGGGWRHGMTVMYGLERPIGDAMEGAAQHLPKRRR